MARKRLQGLRAAALAADGFEQIELTGPLKTLRSEGALVEVISLRRGSIRGMNLLVPAKKVRVDRTVGDANPDAYDALLLPGGFMNPDFLRQSEDALEFVRAFDHVGKPIAVICHGPWVLASAGIVRGRRITSWPGIKHDLINAGALWEDKAVVQDGNWVSSRGPHDLRKFKKAMVALFEERMPFVPAEALEEAEADRGGSPVRGLVRWALIAGAGYALRRFAASQAGGKMREQAAGWMNAGR